MKQKKPEVLVANGRGHSNIEWWWSSCWLDRQPLNAASGSESGQQTRLATIQIFLVSTIGFVHVKRRSHGGAKQHFPRVSFVLRWRC